MTTPYVRFEVEGPVATITLARAEKLNALDMPMIEALVEGADAIEKSREIRCAIITGEGKAFCAGGDIAGWGGLEPLDMWRMWTRLGHRAFDRLARLRVPLIAALSGHALGGGLELAAAADVRVAEPQIKIGLPETGLGMVPGWSGTQRLVRRFGSQNIRRLSLTGVLMTGEEAERRGIVDEIAPQGSALVRARAIANLVSERGPIAVSISKDLINAAEGEETAAAVEGIAGALVSYTADLKEGVSSFREKRSPSYTNT
ncbi:enoyl-CoA hydratase/isomerase family protein [Microvirga aerophila]|uniref:Enoyl-CoA hydratase n=1 Tax=Microvirga aerophila TaxID=670291 RepID=A0A512BLN4_9HYPH|nr:enoyl-CoA hydratase/isomerase family protein [Microvirga aerophila]GEO12874.1 enoyl-CoA hydratase [Microvirga aerophila]